MERRGQECPRHTSMWLGGGPRLSTEWIAWAVVVPASCMGPSLGALGEAEDSAASG